MANTNAIDLELSSSQYLSITDASQTGLDLTTDYTMEMWIKLEQLPSTAAASFGLAEKYQAGNVGYRFEIKSTDKLNMQFTDGASNWTQFVTDDAQAVAGEWMHIACSVDISAPTMTFYVNGVEVASSSTHLDATSINDNAAIFDIGSVNGSGGYFDGQIDEVRVWNDLRTAKEIRQNFNRKLIGNEAGLVGYWKFDGSVLTDSTSNGNSLTNNNSATFSTATQPLVNSHSIDLELSSSQYLSITDASQTGLDITGDITIEAWIKLEQLPSTPNSSFSIASKYNSTSKRDYDFLINKTSDKLRFSYYEDGVTNQSAIDCDTAFVADDLGKWIHVAVGVDVSAATADFYINGVLQTDTVVLSNASSISDSGADFCIGAISNPTSYFDGLIDDVRVWNDIRTADEIADNYRRTLVGDEAGLVGFWRFDGEEMLDETSNNNDLTANNSPVASTDVPFNALGTIDGHTPGNLDKINGVTKGNIAKVNGEWI